MERNTKGAKIDFAAMLKSELINSIEVLSGRWYLNKEEIRNRFKYVNKAYFNKANKYPTSCNIIDDIIEMVSRNNNDEEGIWYPHPLIAKAKEFKPTEEDLKNTFPLEDKQYIIINRLLFHPEDEIMFIATGIGGSGKSTFLNIIKQLFQGDYFSASLSDLSNEFIRSEAIEKRLICSDELGSGDLDLKSLKQLCSKQSMTCNKKNCSIYSMRSQSSLFFCCNKAPKIDITDTGILRRICYYARNTKIKNPDTSLNRKVFNERELLTIAHLAYLKEDDKWEDNFKIETVEYLRKDNSVYLCKDATTYEEYALKCAKKGLKPFSEPRWQEMKIQLEVWDEELKNLGYQERPKLTEVSKDEELPF